MQVSSQPSQPESVTAPEAQTCSLPYRRFAVCVPTAPGIFCLVLICLLALVWPAAIQAQTNAPRSSLRSNRYLLVIENSRAMRTRAEGVARAVQDMIGSGVKGQMRAGDTLGVWMFNDELHTGQIPLQEWGPDAQGPITEKLCEFVRHQRYEKQGRLSNTMPTLLRVIKSSEFITVILISEGTEEIHGTPFDAQINQSFKLWTTQQRDAKMPVMTLLRATRGTITHYAVAPVPWPIEVPPLPNELQLAKVSTNQPTASAVKKAPASSVPPLIVKGKKPEPLPNPAPAAPILVTNDTARIKAAPTLVAAEPQSPTLSAATNAVASTSVHPVQPSTSSHTEPSIPTASGLSHSPGSSSGSETNPPSQIASSLLAPKVPASPTPSTDSTPTMPQSNAPVVSASGPSSTQPPRPTPPDTSASSPTQMGGVPSGSPLFSVTTVAVGATFLLAAGSLALFRKRRPSPTAHISLITRSFEREKH